VSGDSDWRPLPGDHYVKPTARVAEPPRTPEQEWRIEEARQRALKEPPAPPPKWLVRE
jgi:hypothetical protein